MSTKSVSDDVSHLELFSLIWLDDNVKEDRGTQEKLQTAINQLKKFHHPLECQRYIQDRSKDDRIVLIVNGRLGRDLVPCIHHLPQMSSIYVYCMNRTENELWTNDFHKVNYYNRIFDITFILVDKESGDETR